MKSKIISMFLLTVFLSLAIVSAADFTLTTTSPDDFTDSNMETSFTITPNGEPGRFVDVTVTIPNRFTDSDGNELTINPPYSLSFPNAPFGTTLGSIDVTISEEIPSDFEVGRFTTTVEITATDTLDPENTLDQTVPINLLNTFCSDGEIGSDLSISEVKIDNDDGDDEDWSPLDEITIKVEVSNDGDERIRDVKVELGLYNEEGKNIVRDLEDLNDREIDLGKISDGDEDTAEFTFFVPSDFEEEDYRLVVKAFSDDEGEDELCTSESSDFD
ncbi:putative S-layer protein, partial [Candidatus Pacearchaeota archaeon]|nr:putative S-layer protein [Candidatus Pacearchaeota archaeon]